MKKIHSVLTGILIVALLCPAAMAAEPEVTEEQRQAMDFVFDHGILQSDSTGAFHSTILMGRFFTQTTQMSPLRFIPQTDYMVWTRMVTQQG